MTQPEHAAWEPLTELEVITVATSFESPRSTYGPFLLNRYALTWIVRGGGSTFLDEREVVTRPGTVLTMTPGTSLRHNWGRARSLQSFLVFDVPRWPRSWPSPDTWPVVRELSGSETLLQLWRYLLSATHSPAARQVERPTVELLLRMFLSGSCGGEAPVENELPRSLERALDYLVRAAESRERHPALAEIAHAAGVSPQHLCRLFRKELDASPLECAEMLRLERAASRLERTDHTLAEIADELGYSSAFHLSKNFKRVYGAPPRDYRKAFLGGLASRPGGLVFKNHRLRSYLYERGPGRVLLDGQLPAPASAR
jgi:AraC-like DNA-binding protein